MTPTLVTPDGWLLPILLCPLLGALIAAAVALARPVRGERVAGVVAIAAMVAASAAALAAFGRLLLLPPGQRALHQHLFTMLAVDRLHVDVALSFDPLAAVFTLVITLAGTLIHVYAAGYMRGDPGYARFFACLNLFVFAMLVLVLGDSLWLCFVGWEGVGLCSYLLIGFWFEARDAGPAAQKAFIANRIGDVGFLFAMLVLAPTLQFRDLAAAIDGLAGATLWGVPVLVLAATGFFVAMAGKSAQIPLYLWLPDAMAGPTPVSALIHAATMVTAGVYLAARLDFLYALVPQVQAVIAVVGVATALLAGVLALVQHDLKKVLAYSTISQLGFMFLGVGAGAPTAAVFHVVTHAAFKACLFLAAGSAIHAMSEALGGHGAGSAEARRRLVADPADPQDMRNMNAAALGAALPRTRRAYFAGALALAGLPVASGFFSKDEILLRALHAPHLPGGWLYGAALVAAALTAFYAARSYYLAFPVGGAGHGHAHEPALMSAPLGVLAVAALVVGPLLGWPAAWGAHPLLEGFLAPGTAHAVAVGAALRGQLLGAAVALAGWVGGRALYRDGRHRETLLALRARFDGVHRALWNRLYADDLARAVVVHPAQDFARAASALDRGFIEGLIRALVTVARGLAALGAWLDRHIVDGVIDGIAAALAWAGGRLQRVQTGRLNHYTLGITLGAALVVVLAWIIR